MNEKDLQALAQLLDEKIASMESRLDAAMDEKIQASENRMMAYFEGMVSGKVNLLGESLTTLGEKLERMPVNEDLEPLELRLEVVEAMIRKHSREIAELEKAQ